jgi:hypothetical protein
MADTRSNSPASSGPPSGPSRGSDRPRDDAAALVRTIQKDVAHRERARKAPSGAGRKRRWQIALLIALAANVYVWVGRPAWIVGDPPGVQTAAEEEGVLRFRMYVQGQRIETFRREHGELPERLEETGPPLEGMRYQRTGPTSWELLGESGGVQLLLRSSQPMAEFLGSYQEPLGVNGR